MNPFELPIDSSEEGDLVGACVPWTPSAHAGATDGVVVDIIVGAIVGELVHAGVAIMLTMIHNPITRFGTESWRVSGLKLTTPLASHSPNLNRRDRQE